MITIKNALTAIFVSLLMLSPQELIAQHHTGYGNISFEIPCSETASEKFRTGLALLHHMMYEQAREQFRQSAESDPGCAMPHWGIAMSYIHPLWGERPSEEALDSGNKAVARAMRLDPATGREKAYISAVGAFYEQWEDRSYSEQLAAFEEGYRALNRAYPEDVDAAAFYALSHLATAPPGDETLSHQKRAGTMLEELLERSPEHPGLFHYTIHAYDNPVLAERAVPVARAYDKLAPDVPHALHMPSHIFVRQGLWADVIEWNHRSAEAALRQSGEQTSLHYVHALDYLAYAYLQRGEDQKAKEVIQKTLTVDNLQEQLASAYAVAAAEARFFLEREEWEAAAGLTIRSSNGFPVEDFPAAESIVHYARGIGSALSGDLAGAAEALRELDRLHETLMASEMEYWAALTDAQRTSIAAWIAYGEGETERALDLMIQAANTEDAVGKHPVTPGHVLPARELLGDMLLASGQPGKALEAYRASLDISENRFRSLYGLGRAAEESSDYALALSTYRKLVSSIPEGAADDREQLDLARSFIANNRP